MWVVQRAPWFNVPRLPLMRINYQLKLALGYFCQAEELNEKLERDNSDLAKQVATLQLTVEKYEEVEQELSDKEVRKATASVLLDFPFLDDPTATIKICSMQN